MPGSFQENPYRQIPTRSRLTNTKLHHAHPSHAQVPPTQNILFTLVISCFVFYVVRELRSQHPFGGLSRLLVEIATYLLPTTVLFFVKDSLARNKEPRPIGPVSYQQKREAAIVISRRFGTSLHLFVSPAMKFFGIDRRRKASRTSTSARSGSERPVCILNRSMVHCYQNSILQALSTSKSVRKFLNSTKQAASRSNIPIDHTRILSTTLQKLNGVHGLGYCFVVPATLALLGGHDQEDAQEYLGRLIDCLEKEAIAVRKLTRPLSPPSSNSEDNGSTFSAPPLIHPFKGVCAVRMACTSCGYVSSVREESFEFITLPLSAAKHSTSLTDELDKYFAMEHMDGVHCNKCTVLSYHQEVHKLRTSMKKPHDSVERKLAAIKAVIDNGDFDDKIIASLNIPKRIQVAITKSKQSGITCAPQHLIFHIGRVGYDMWGHRAKIDSVLHYPTELDLGPWLVGSTKEFPAIVKGDLTSPIVAAETFKTCESWRPDPKARMVASTGNNSLLRGPQYRLMATVRHYGITADGGHYTCIRHEPKISNNVWWEISDEEVWTCRNNNSVTGSYMLFYECIDSNARHALSPDVPPCTEQSTTRSVEVGRLLTKADHESNTQLRRVKSAPNIVARDSSCKLSYLSPPSSHSAESSIPSCSSGDLIPSGAENDNELSSDTVFEHSSSTGDKRCRTAAGEHDSNDQTCEVGEEDRPMKKARKEGTDDKSYVLDDIRLQLPPDWAPPMALPLRKKNRSWSMWN